MVPFMWSLPSSGGFLSSSNRGRVASANPVVYSQGLSLCGHAGCQAGWQDLPRPSEPRCIAKAAHSEAGHPLSHLRSWKPVLMTQASNKRLGQLRPGKGPCCWQFRPHPSSFPSRLVLCLGSTRAVLTVPFRHLNYSKHVVVVVVSC